MKPKTILVIPDEFPDKYLDMPDGLDGYWWETENLICVPFVAAQNEGNGSFSRFLKEIEAKGKWIFFPTIISARLNYILRARGCKDAVTPKPDATFGEHIFGLAKKLKTLSSLSASNEKKEG